jgi:hypothetical protein
MDILLRTELAPKVYLVTGRAQDVAPVAVTAPAPEFLSLIKVDNWNRFSGRIADDGTIKSHNVVILRTRDDNSLFREDASARRLMSEFLLHDPRFDESIFEIRRSGGRPGDLISSGDRVAFGLVDPRPGVTPRFWMADSGVPSMGTRTITFAEQNEPTGSENLFEVVLPVDIERFNAPRDAEIPFRGSTQITGEVRVGGGAGTAPPGGLPFVLTIDPSTAANAPNLVPNPSRAGEFGGAVQEGAETAAIELQLQPHLGTLAPSLSRDVELSVLVPATGTTHSRILTLRAVPTPFISVRIDNVRETGCFPLQIIPFLPFPRYLVVSAPLLLEHRGSLPLGALPLRVTLTGDAPLEGFVQLSNALSEDQSISFVFNIQQPAEGQEIRAAIHAYFQVEHELHTHNFTVKVAGGAVVVERS